VRRFQLQTTQPSTSLRALFELLKADHQRNPSEETTQVLVDAMRMIMAKSVEKLSAGDRSGGRVVLGYYEFGYGVQADRDRDAAFGQLFTDAATCCYAMDRSDLVGGALFGAMQTTKWQSSKALAQLVATHIGRAAPADGSSGADTWSRL